MLRNIAPCISPDLMHVLMSMGHGDEIVFADADFPGPSNAKRLIRADGIEVETLLKAVLPLFPLDSFVDRPAITMDCSEWGDEPESYGRYRKILKKHYKSFTDFGFEKRFDFYKRAQNAYAVVMTSEPDGNVILKKGPVMM
jgi:L-fucose mutarotase